jgi:ABC-type phosphate transport system auxiliary subunit
LPALSSTATRPSVRRESASVPWSWACVSGIVLLVSFALRVVLAWRGGQQFWPDEDRYE